ncbi:MAG: hypothetical protein PHD61_09335 [Bacteroidales bacterium]|nr:hypothetical protein [Lentimicrobiaceae bacterium]MDD5695488.1 hypothetical protein [Bacteroidales bacterium]
MKPRLILLFALYISSILTKGQGITMELTFTAVNNQTYIQLDSIKVMNLIQGGDTILYWPDNEKVYLFTALWREMSRSIKILHNEAFR